ncbi:MAG: thermonuclease family protein [Phyllobacteriaceae bacterium]|nr:thermonuclease family protein [Phyllobacteriaceae bacterium]
MRQRHVSPFWNGLRRMVESALVLVVLVLLGVSIQQFMGEGASAAPGAIRIIDGDSLVVGGTEVRLWGIDAPELRQGCIANGATVPCGRKARERLVALVQGQSVSCIGSGKDRYDRLLAVCSTARGVELNATLVREGLAYDFGGYGAEEAQARNAKLGVWAGKNERPKAYRDRTRAGMEDEAGLSARLFHFVRRWLQQFKGGQNEAV